MSLTNVLKTHLCREQLFSKMDVSHEEKRKEKRVKDNLEKRMLLAMFCVDTSSGSHFA